MVKRSRLVLLGTAFIGVMVGAGGLLGSVAGVVLVLLGRSVLGINAGTGEFIAAWTLAGGFVAMLFGLFLTMRESRQTLVMSRVTASAKPVTESN